MPEINNNSTDNELIIEEVEEVEEEVETVFSEIQDRDIDVDEAVWLDRYGTYVTETYSANNCTTCGSCGDRVLDEDFDGDEDECNACVEDRDEEESPSTRNANTKSVSHQSEEEGKYIKSKRKFGVEIECGFDNFAQLLDSMNRVNRDYGFVHDGSVDCSNGIEIVTPILQGKKGEESLITTLDIINQNNVYVDNSCGLHVHLDGSDLIKKNSIEIKHVQELKALTDSEIRKHLEKSKTFIQSEILDVLAYETYGTRILFSQLDSKQKEHVVVTTLLPLLERVREEGVVKNYNSWFVTNDQDETIKSNSYWVRTLRILNSEESKIQDEYVTQKFNNYVKERGYMPQTVPNFGLGFRDGRVNIYNFYHIVDNSSSDLRSVKNIMGFYHVFSDVILSMLPETRRNNHYCQKITDKFTLKQLQNTSSLDDLLRLWYETTNIQNIKASRMHDKYDDSRYYGVNFHSLFKNGTVEIRYHSGTTNKNKILFWIHLHQTILDRIVSGSINSDTLRSVANTVGVSTKLKLFFELLKLPKKLEDYVKTRIAHLNNVSKKSLSTVSQVEYDEID